jgi:hypothetical protein
MKSLPVQKSCRYLMQVRMDSRFLFGQKASVVRRFKPTVVFFRNNNFKESTNLKSSRRHLAGRLFFKDIFLKSCLTLRRAATFCRLLTSTAYHPSSACWSASSSRNGLDAYGRSDGTFLERAFPTRQATGVSVQLHGGFGKPG